MRHDSRGDTSVVASGFSDCPLMWTPAGRVHVLWLRWTNSLRPQKSCGDKGTPSPLSKWERGPQSLPGQAFTAFLGTWHRGWSSFTMHRFAVGDYLLQITKERMLLITSKRRMFQMQGEKWLNWLHSILGWFSTDFRNLLWRYEVNICCLNPGWGSFSKNKPHGSLGTMQAWFPTGKPICGHGFCVPTLLPTGLSE